ncbi:unnamed protein product [Chrysodeixis includens]|uniref:Uncharacterized protein n=1 Tax=Chrysodeixis includens TaxID=689277 RepID=A0A9N8KP66_CHRIL|nr:unnamed protein product [Chrysodeixis includens]
MAQESPRYGAQSRKTFKVNLRGSRRVLAELAVPKYRANSWVLRRLLTLAPPSGRAAEPASHAAAPLRRYNMPREIGSHKQVLGAWQCVGMQGRAGQGAGVSPPPPCRQEGAARGIDRSGLLHHLPLQLGKFSFLPVKLLGQ